MQITDEVRSYARQLAGGRCECQGANCRHHRGGSRCKRGLRADQWKVYWRTERGGMSRANLEAWCLDCFQNNFTVPTTSVTMLFSEIEGYRALVKRQRRKAITLLSVLRDTAERVATSNRGRVLEANAHDVRLEFPKSAYAVTAARELHDSFRDNTQRLKLPNPGLRSGLHQGEVTRTRSGDVYGEALGQAELIKAVAEAGQIVLSSAVAEQLPSRLQIEDLGERVLGEVADRLKCFALVG